MKQYFKISFFIFFIFFSFAFVNLVFIDTVVAGNQGVVGDTPDTTVSLTNPLNTASPQILIGNIIKAVLGIVGSLALVMFIYGGLIWMTSSGNSEQVQKGKDILIWAALGLVIIFSSYALVKFVINAIVAKT